MKTIRHSFEILNQDKEEVLSECHGISFENQGTNTVTLSVNGTPLDMATGKIVGFSGYDSQLKIKTVFSVKFTGVGTSKCFIIREHFE